MSVKSLNKVQLIGNLTHDPELRYTPSGTAVCTFGLATNRSWTTDTGEKKEATEFHRVVAWNKLAELCSQLLTKGRKAYVEGRLQTRNWQGQDGAQRTTTEVVISDMIVLDSKRSASSPSTTGVTDDNSSQARFEDSSSQEAIGDESVASQDEVADKPEVKETAGVAPAEQEAEVEAKAADTEPNTSENKKEDINPDDIPF